jgi:hypothetical protein
MRKLLMIVMIVVLGPCLWGQTASVDGLVTSSLTGERLARVHVILKDPANKTGVQYGAQTTDEGKFSVAGIAPGSYLVSGERVGFAGGRARVTLKADDKKSDLEVKLTPVGAITGRVTDAEGRPVERASVIAEGAEKKEAGTDENGQFRIGGLAPGKYRVKAAHESSMYRFYFMRPEIRADGTTEVFNSTTYYPGVLTAKQAGKVDVRPGGESTGIDIQLLGVPFVRVSGKVAGMPRGAPQAYAFISWRGGGQGNQMSPDGSFEFWGLDPGKYKLSAGWGAPGGEEEIWGSRANTPVIEIEVAGSNIDNIELRLVPDSNITGRLELDTPEGPQPTPQRTITLRDVSNGSAIGTPVAVGADDTFKMEKVHAGQYIVGLSWDSAYVKSMRLGTTKTDGDVLDLSNGAGGAELTLELGTVVDSVAGTVHDDRGNAAEARVILARDRGEDAIFASQSVRTKADGGYSFAKVPPGSYKLLAVPEDDADLVLQGYGLAEYNDVMNSVEIHAGETVALDLDLRTTADK